MNKQVTAENRMDVCSMFGHTPTTQEITAALRVAEQVDLTISFRAYSPSEQRSGTGDLRARIYFCTLNWGYSTEEYKAAAERIAAVALPGENNYETLTRLFYTEMGATHLAEEITRQVAWRQEEARLREVGPEPRPEYEGQLVKVSSPMQWGPGRINGGVTLDSTWKVEIDGKPTPPIWWSKQKDLLMKEINAARSVERQARRLVSRERGINPGYVTWDEFEFVPSSAFLAELQALIAHQQVCEEVLAAGPVPPHWRRYEFVGCSAEQLIAAAKQWWVENSTRLAEGPLGLDYWLNQCQRFY